jgi:TPR repeat protein
MACEAGDFTGCGQYGWNWTQGRGMEKNPTKGMRLLEVACENGDVWSCKKEREAAPINRRGIRPPGFPRTP